MKTTKLLAFLLLFSGFLKSQPSSNLYGIVRQNYYSTVTDTLVPGYSYEVFDSATIRLGSINPASGFVNNIGTNTINRTINLTGAALNPYDTSFVFMSYRAIISLDLITGNTNSCALTYGPLEESYFDMFRFNNADSSLYGLARTNYISRITDPSFPLDSFDVLDSTALRLATVNTNTGLISMLSSTSIGEGFAMAGSTIDPYQMVFYYSNGYRFIGLDIYDGSVYSDVHIYNPDGDIFDNFAYSCADTGIYGLIRKNCYSWTSVPGFPGDSFQTLDSSTIRLGKINPNTGIVTIISPSGVAFGGYSINAGSAIDPNTMTYYFSNGMSIIGISMVTGLKVSEARFDFEAGEYFDLMRNFENCRSAIASRKSGETNILPIIASNSTFSIYPNPTTSLFQISSTEPIQDIRITDVSGKMIMYEKYGDGRLETTLSIINDLPGMYFVTVNNNSHRKLIVK
jgi:Secretion system C-terminal sorting domain